MQTFKVQGMTCGHCVKAVSNAVQALDGQARVEVDLAQGQVTVDSAAERSALAAAIREEGYEVLDA